MLICDLLFGLLQGIVMKKAREAIAAMLLHVVFAPFVPHIVVMTGAIGQMSILIWFPYLIVALFLVRCQYYFAWIFGRFSCFIAFVNENISQLMP